MELDGSDRAQRLALEPGDILGLISDGVYEFATEEGREFGEEGVAKVFAASHDKSMKNLSQDLVAAALEFGDGASQADDITLVLVKRER